MEWSNEVIKQFLNLCEGEPSIWNPQNADHKDAWKRIQDGISNGCSLEEVKKKIEHLMATFRKLILKLENSTKTGAGTKEAYRPEWFAYENMHNIQTPRKTKTSDEGPENEQVDQSTSVCVSPDSVESSDINITCYDEESHETAATEAAIIDKVGPPTSRKRQAEEPENAENRMDEGYISLKQVAKKSKVAKDESSLFCDLLCLKLKALDDDTREIAMHEIDNLMFDLKKSKIQQLYCHNCQQPEYFENTVPHSRDVNPIESAVNEPENSFSSYASSEYNPPTTTGPQYCNNDNQIEIPCYNAPEYIVTFNIN